MKYFLAIMACMMLDIIDPIEPTGCSRDNDYVYINADVQKEAPATTTAPMPAE